MTIHLLGPIRGGKNQVNITRKGHRYPNPKWAAWRDSALAQVMKQRAGKPTLETPQKATVLYWKPDLKRRDVPAAMDAIWHVLERSGVVADDSLIESVDWVSCGLDRKNPRATITLEAMK